MLYKQFVPAFSPHDPSKLDQGPLVELKDVFNSKFLAWHYTNRDRTKAESFSFQLNEATPTSTIQNPPQYLINLDLPGGAHYVIGHLWMSSEEIAHEAETLSKVHPLAEIYTGNELIFQPIPLE